jgi:hypothetical protein
MGDLAKQAAAKSVVSNGLQQAAMASSGANRQATPIGIRAIGFGLLGAALAMGIFETMQMMHVVPSLRTLMRRCSMLTALRARASSNRRTGSTASQKGKQGSRRGKSSDRSELVRTDISTDHEPVSSQSARGVRGQSRARFETSVESILSTATAGSIAAAGRLAVMLQQSGCVAVAVLPFYIKLKNRTR